MKMGLKKLSDADKKEYKRLCKFAAFLSEKDFPNTLVVNIPVFEGKPAQLKCKGAEYLCGFWDEGTSGYVLCAPEGCVIADDVFVNKLNIVWQKQIDKCMAQIDAWEKKTGLEFDGFR